MSPRSASPADALLALATHMASGWATNCCPVGSPAGKPDLSGAQPTRATRDMTASTGGERHALAGSTDPAAVSSLLAGVAHALHLTMSSAALGQLGHDPLHVRQRQARSLIQAKAQANRASADRRCSSLASASERSAHTSAADATVTSPPSLCWPHRGPRALYASCIRRSGIGRFVARFELSCPLPLCCAGPRGIQSIGLPDGAPLRPVDTTTGEQVCETCSGCWPRQSP